MSILAVDIGNSTIVLGIVNNNEVVQRIRFKSKGINTVFSLTKHFDSALSNYKKEITDIALSSVVPSLTALVAEALETVLEKNVVYVTRHNAPLVNLNSIPSQMGNDLISNVVAARCKYPNSNVCVVDFGTALSFSTISKTGDVLGVSIAPGIVTGANALDANTAQLHIVDIQIPDKAIGRNTTDSLLSGLVFGSVGAVKEIVARIENEVEGELKVVLTGGLSTFVGPLIGFGKIDKYHTLKGISQFITNC